MNQKAIILSDDTGSCCKHKKEICLAFTVDDIDREYEKVLALGAEIIEPPTKRPWGAVNMSFYDPDNNMVFFRSFSENE